MIKTFASDVISEEAAIYYDLDLGVASKFENLITDNLS